MNFKAIRNTIVTAAALTVITAAPAFAGLDYGRAGNGAGTAIDKVLTGVQSDGRGSVYARSETTAAAAAVVAGGARVNTAGRV